MYIIKYSVNESVLNKKKYIYKKTIVCDSMNTKTFKIMEYFKTFSFIDKPSWKRQLHSEKWESHLRNVHFKTMRIKIYVRLE